MADSADEPDVPRKPTRLRLVRQAYRVSAVRRPLAGSEATPVTDEEVVHALTVAREEFAERLRRHAGGRLFDVTLRDVRPASSVRLELTFSVARADAAEVLDHVTAAVILAVEERLKATLNAPVAVSAALETAKAAVANPAPSSGWDKIAPVLAVIGTGIGVLGFVTFIGGAIVWGRLNGNGLPAAPALSVYPTQDLLVIGAQTLVPELLTALGLVALLATLYVVLRRLFYRVGQFEEQWLTGRATRLMVGSMFAFALLALALTLAPFLDDLSRVHKLWAYGSVLLGAGLAAMIASVTHRFVYLAVTTFVLVGVSMSFVAYLRARDDTQLRGAALIRTDGKTITGIWLTEGSGRVYLARGKPGPDGKLTEANSRIIGVDKSVVSDLAIAGAQPVEKAFADGRALARELCRMHPKAAAKGHPNRCPGDAPAKPKPVAPPKLVAYNEAVTLAPEGAIVRLPALSEGAVGVVSFITRDKVWVASVKRREQVTLSTKPFRAQAGYPIRVRLRLSSRARRALDDAGGALAVKLRVVAIGETGVAGHNEAGCVLISVRPGAPRC